MAQLGSLDDGIHEVTGFDPHQLHQLQQQLSGANNDAGALCLRRVYSEAIDPSASKVGAERAQASPRKPRMIPLKAVDPPAEGWSSSTQTTSEASPRLLPDHQAAAIAPLAVARRRARESSPPEPSFTRSRPLARAKRPSRNSWRRSREAATVAWTPKHRGTRRCARSAREHRPPRPAAWRHRSPDRRPTPRQRRDGVDRSR